MVSETSKQAYAPKSQIREQQKYTILRCLLDYAATGNALIAEEIQSVTGIKITTVYARINDLRKGCTLNGVTYYAIEAGRDKNADGKTCNKYTVTTVCLEINTPEYIERLRKQAIESIIKYRTARKQAINSLFDNQQ